MGLLIPERLDQPLGRCRVQGHRDVVDERKAHQRLHVDVVRMRGKRVDEEEQDIDLSLGNQRTDLLVAACAKEHGLKLPSIT